LPEMVRPPRPADEGASKNVFKVALFKMILIHQYVLKLSLLSIYLVLMSRSSTNLVPLSNQGIVQQSGSIILLGMRFSLNLAVKVFREPNF